ncbi:MAG: hypothetical protein IT215_07455 [Chitinophagaceae bacterium]|nr:hypothetical protein [Chitinophagaceae bacterium]
MNNNLLRIAVGFCFVAFFSSCKLEIDAAEVGPNGADLLNLTDKAGPDVVTDRKNKPDEKILPEKKKKPKKAVEVLDFNENNTYVIDVSGLITDQQEHIPYEEFKNPKNIGKLFEEIMSKSISHENSKRLDPVIEKVTKISKYYAKNQADLFYFLGSFVESLNKTENNKRKFQDDYYHPYQYIHYGVSSNFENMTLLSTILYDVCYRPKISIIDLDVNKSRIGIELFRRAFDYNQIFQNDEDRMENFKKLVMKAPRCNVDAESLIKKQEEMGFSADETKLLNVESKLSKDGSSLELTIQATEAEALSEYYKNTILLIDSVDMKFVVKSIKDNSPVGFILGPEGVKEIP